MATKKKTPKSKKTAPKKTGKVQLKLQPTLSPEQLAIAPGAVLYRVTEIDGEIFVQARTVLQAGKNALVLSERFSGMNGSPIARSAVGGEIALSAAGALSHAQGVAQAAFDDAAKAYDIAETNLARVEQLLDATLDAIEPAAIEPVSAAIDNADGTPKTSEQILDEIMSVPVPDVTPATEAVTIV
jgi:hypothetical protein